ncbi:MAG: PqqD family protein [Clostridiaceae bacterium]|nr:PqqD family protein [Clostridiaceae bacterium]
MGNKIKRKDNILMLVPKKREGQQWRTKEDGLVEIIIRREKLLDRIVRVFIPTPRVMRIHLDPMGSCVWEAIDGIKNVKEIGEVLKERFGENAEPLYERLITYISILRNNKFITLGNYSNKMPSDER